MDDRPRTDEAARAALDEARLRRAFRLPAFDGRAAQVPMEPAFRGPVPPAVAGDEPREAAALAYVFRGAPEGRLLIPITLRPDHLREHRGQVSLPGGRPEPRESLRDTARREALEEVGLDAGGAEEVGRLGPVYIPVTHTRLHVFVALGDDPRPLCARTDEVAAVAFAPVDDLLDPRCRRVETRRIRGRAVEVPFFLLAGLEVWGATAMALSELAERLRAAAGAERGRNVAAASPDVSPP